jgi:hypothetical protein
VQVRPKELLTKAGPALVAEVLQRFGTARIQVGGTSMLPAIRPRDVLIVEPRGLQDIRVTDVVLFTLNNRLFAHRVVRTGVDDAGCLFLVTRGDTHRDEDLPIASPQLLGQVVTVWRNGRAHQAPFASSRAGSLAWRAAASCVHIASRLRGRVNGPDLVATVPAGSDNRPIDRHPSR